VKRELNGHQVDRGARRARWVEKYRASGLSLKQFGEQHGLSFGQLHYWVYGSSKRETAPMFQEMRLCGAVAPAGVWSAEVGLPDGTTVRLARGAEVEWIQALVECLRRPCSSP
jgi:hypothetical protein